MMDDDATHAPRVPTKLRTKRGATKRMSELCALDDLGRPSEEAPNASTMDADDAPTSMNAPADAVDTLNTDLAEHNEASLPSPAPFSRDASAMPPPRPPARVGSLPHLGLHIHIPSNPATPTDDKPASAKSSYLSQEESQEEHVPPVTPATALTVLPLHAAVAAGNVAAVREWLDARVPAGDAAAKKPALGETTSTPEWPPRPVRDILGPGSESREPWGAKTSPGMPGDAPVPGDVPGDRDAAARLGEMARARAAGVAPPPVGRESDRSSAGGEGRRGPVDVRNEHGNTALAVAAALEDASAAEATAALLLERGASPLALSGGWTPLHWAAQQGNTDALKKMAAWEGGRGVNARASDTGDTPLMVAAAAGRVDCCEALLAAGAEALATNASGVGVLACAASRVSKGSRLKVRSATRAALLRLEPKLRVLVLHHADCDAHVSMKPHQESPERIAAVLETCARAAATGALPEHETVSSSTFEPAQFEHLRRCHSEEYIGVITELGERVAGTPVAFTPYYQGLKGKKQKKKELSDTFFSPGTMAAALRAAGGVVHAVERVLTNQARTAFVCVRPPGHHAGTDGATAGAPSSGFSILNNAMIGALHALEGNGGRLARRVAVVDFDVHHGNGTEEIARAWHERHRRSLARAGGAARDDRDVFFASIHLADDGKGSGVEFYPGTGVTSDLHQNVVNVVVPPMWRAQENVSDAVGSRKRVPKRNRDDELDGSGAALTAAKAKEKKEKEERENVAKEALLSESLVPAPPRVGDAPAGGREEWMRRLRERVLPALRAFKPDLLIISAGFDAANHDVGNVGVDRRGRRAGGANLTPEDYEEMTNRLCAVASSAGGKVVSVLEGGYGHLVENPADGTASLNRENFAACVVAHVRGLAGLGAPVKD